MKTINKSLKLIISASVLAVLAMGGTGCDINNNDDVAGLPKNNQAVIIGDSIFALSGEIKEFLALQAGENYRGSAMSGAKVIGNTWYGAQAIPTQYTNERSSNSNIRTIIMDGGGNDILGQRSSCEPFSPSCQAILDNVADALESLFVTMNNDGVQDIVYLGYYYMPRSNASLNPAMDVGIALLMATCDGSPAPCHFVDARPLFLGNEEAWVNSDDIHPNRTGSEVLANGIWNEMVAKGIEQNANLLVDNAAQ